MAGDFEVTGTEQFVAMAKRLNGAGKQGRGLWRELNAEIKLAAEPMTKAVLSHLDAYLPSGYVPVIKHGLTVRVSRATKGNAVGLKLVATAKGVRRKRHISVINAGTLRHPVYSNPNAWVNQKVKPGFWSTPLDLSRDIPAKHIRRAIQKTIRKL